MGVGLWNAAARRYLLPQAAADATHPGGAGTASHPGAFFNVAFRPHEPFQSVGAGASVITDAAWWRDKQQGTAVAANDIWAMDFVHDQLFDGKKIRILTIIDTLTRLSPAVGVRQSYRGSDVVETLERGGAEFG